MNTIYDAKILIVDDNADLLALLCEQRRRLWEDLHSTKLRGRTRRLCGRAAGADDLGHQPAGRGRVFFIPCAAGQSGCAGVISISTGCGCRPAVRAGAGGGRLPDKALFDAGAVAAGAAYSAAGLPGGIVSCKTDGIAAWAAQRRPERCRCQPARRKNIGADGYRAGPAAQAGRKPGAYRDL